MVRAVNRRKEPTMVPIYDLQNDWINLWPDAEPLDVLETYASLARKYSRLNWAYHNLTHIAGCLNFFNQNCARVANARAVAVALWYHDVVYHPQRKDNERQSALYAQVHLVKLGYKAGDTFVSDVERLIMATTHAGGLTARDEQLIADIDLVILGTHPEKYQEYSRAIRLEYIHVPEDDYRAGRVKVLQKFLDRPQIYYGDIFRMSFEDSARKNLKNEVKALS